MELKTKIKKTLEKIKKEDKEINSFLVLREEKEILKDAENSKGKLAGKIIGVKSNICVKGLKTSCASKVLENYVAPYDATVIERIKKEGGIIIGMTNMDEFACGFSGESSAFGATKNPVNLKYVPGGSSSGSAAAVSAGFCDIALGSDTGGSIRNPSSHCGVVGLKPSYGAVSRYGLIDLSMSLDQIGPIAKNVEDVALLFSVIQGKDEKDPTTLEISKINLEEIKKPIKDIKVGILDLEGLNYDERIYSLLKEKIEKASEKYGWKLKTIKLNYLDLAVETYYPLVYVEFFSGTRKFDGRKYGKKIEEYAGPEVLRRVFGGSEISKAEYRGRYYNSALKVKSLITKEFEKAFKEVDCIVCPVTPRLPWKIGEKISIEEAYASDVFTVPSSLAGNCALSLPIGKIDSLPAGMQIICDKAQEEKLLRIGRSIESLNE